jgi:hypothetical protein
MEVTAREGYVWVVYGGFGAALSPNEAIRLATELWRAASKVSERTAIFQKFQQKCLEERTHQ